MSIVEKLGGISGGQTIVEVLGGAGGRNVISDVISEHGGTNSKYVRMVNALPEKSEAQSGVVYLIEKYSVELYYNGWSDVSFYGLSKQEIVDAFPDNPDNDTAYLIINGDIVTAGAINPLTSSFMQKTIEINQRISDPQPLDFFVGYDPDIYMLDYDNTWVQYVGQHVQ